MAKPTGIGADIISLRNAGRTYDQIQEELSTEDNQLSKNTINYHCKKSGLTDIGFKKVQVSDEVVKEIYDYCKIIGNTISMASKKFDLSISTIKKYKKGGIINVDANEESHDE